MFLDIGVGILVAMLTSDVFKAALTFWLVIFSVLFALLPDADFLYFYPKRHDTKYDHKHRDLIHYPLLYLPIGSLIIWVIFGQVYGFIFFLSSFFHFLHDSIGIGWGIKWLYPFSENNFSFFYLYSRKYKRGLKKLVFIFTKENISKYVTDHGDPDWVKNIYYKWHPIAVVEFLVFILSIIALIFYVR